MKATLKIEGGPSHGRQMLVRANQKVRFGRGELMDFSVPEDGVMSSTHFEVECFSDRCVIRDLRSRNGTWLNQQAVSAEAGERLLKTGDQLKAGETLFLVTVRSTEESVMAQSKPRPRKLNPRGTVESFLDESSSGSQSSVDLLRPEGDSINFIPGAVAIFDVVKGTGSGQAIPVKIGQTFSVGRSRQTDFPFPDDLAMSGRHLQMEFLAGEVAVHDLGSRNGMLVNGILCKRAILIEGDRVVAGDTVFVMRFDYPQSGKKSRYSRTMQVPPVASEPVLQQVVLAGLSYQRFDCRSGLALFRGFESRFDPMQILSELARSFATSVLMTPPASKPNTDKPKPTDAEEPSFERVPLFDWLAEDQRAVSPQWTGPASINQAKRDLHELWGNDSVLCFMHKTDDQSLTDSVRAFVRQQSNGPLKALATQLDFYRPSCLIELLANGDAEEMKSLAGSAVAIFTEIHQGDRWACFAPREFEAILKSHGLAETPRWKR